MYVCVALFSHLVHNKACAKQSSNPQSRDRMRDESEKNKEKRRRAKRVGDDARYTEQINDMRGDEKCNGVTDTPDEDEAKNTKKEKIGVYGDKREIHHENICMRADPVH